MRSTGILRSWDDERGFGFIVPTQGGAELFVHISALPRDGSRPVVGETLSFELGRGKDGRPQAVKVIRLAVGADAKPSRVRTATPEGSSALGWLFRGLLLVLIVAAGSWGYSAYQARAQRLQLEALPATTTVPESLRTREGGVQLGTPAYRCDGRTTCSQMTSCAEATWFINHCPGTQMDGNHDGVPCEQQWCTAPGARWRRRNACASPTDTPPRPTWPPSSRSTTPPSRRALAAATSTPSPSRRGGRPS